ncbi:C1QL [Mytilus coruscus]|uniref:C1QL n=1 Tax=Mytilus coruscus TaxID=42192 RepID=A0A6J8DQH3_MYTCO|nr:C1QL [Mytilus coruscus]
MVKSLFGWQHKEIPFLEVNDAIRDDREKMANILNIYFSDQSNIDDSNARLPDIEKFTSKLSTIEITGNNVEDIFLNLDTSEAIEPDCLLLAYHPFIRNTGISGVVTFSVDEFSVGVNNISAYKTSGIFICESSDVYLVSVSTLSPLADRKIRVVLNGHHIFYTRFLPYASIIIRPFLHRVTCNDAPLKAELDITTLTEQLEITALVKREVDISLETAINDTIHRVRNENILTVTETMQKQIEARRKVALTACSAVSDIYRVIRFQSMKMSVGIQSLSSFLSTGKFTAEHSGLYQITVTIMTEDSGRYFDIKKNGATIISGYSQYHDSNQRWHTSTITTAVELDVGDQLYVFKGSISNVYANRSCITIIKVQ